MVGVTVVSPEVEALSGEGRGEGGDVECGG